MGEIFGKLSIINPHVAPRDDGGLKRQEEIQHKINGYEDRWQGIEAQNATWWSETSNNLTKEFRPDILEKLKTTNPLLFGGELPPFDTKFDITDANLTGGIVLTQKEQDALKDRINRFNEGVGNARNDWNNLQKDLNNENFTPQEINQLQKTDASLLFKAELPPSYKKAHDDYAVGQKRKAEDEAIIRNVRGKQAFGERMDEALAPQDLPPKKFDIDQGLKSSKIDAHVLASSLEPPPALTTSNFEKHLQPHTPPSLRSPSENFSNISMGEITNPTSKVAVPSDPPSSPPPPSPPVKY